jgi:CarboxypepD_reg-like domain
MSNKINLTIPTPCHENWDKMTPVEKGRFCGSCQKQVVDFSTMTDHELAQFFKKPILSQSKDGSVCGRFMTEQLHRDIELPKKRIPWLKYFFQMALPALFLTKASAQQTRMSKAVVNDNDTTKMKVTNDNRILGLVLPTTFSGRADTAIVESPITKLKMIKGKITDEKGEPISFATITETNTGNIIVADAKGMFSLNLKNSLGNLLIASGGYETQKLCIAELGAYTEVKLSINNQAGEIAASSAGTYIKGEIAGDLGSRGPVKKEPAVETDEIIQRDIEIPADRNRFYIYPNPIKSGGNISAGVHLLEEGYYTVQFTSQSGQIVYQKEIWIDAAAKVLNIDAPVIAAGNYFITLVSKKTTKKFTEKIIIQ